MAGLGWAWGRHSPHGGGTEFPPLSPQGQGGAHGVAYDAEFPPLTLTLGIFPTVLLTPTPGIFPTVLLTLTLGIFPTVLLTPHQGSSPLYYSPPHQGSSPLCCSPSHQGSFPSSSSPRGHDSGGWWAGWGRWPERPTWPLHPPALVPLHPRRQAAGGGPIPARACHYPRGVGGAGCVLHVRPQPAAAKPAEQRAGGPVPLHAAAPAGHADGAAEAWGGEAGGGGLCVWRSPM